MTEVSIPGAVGDYEITLGIDTILPLRKTPAAIEKETGYRPHENVVDRWRRCGVRGVRLPTTLIGGRRFTSTQAVAWFLARINENDRAPGQPVALGGEMSAGERSALQRAGILVSGA